jgi:uncharacterized repeat protein (TIGR01451 family)
VGEFNTFASPTYGVARKRLEMLFGATWTDWAGRYFTDLSDDEEVPVWARRNWLKHYGTVWNFKGPGYLVTHSDTRLFVLESGIDVGKKGMKITDVRQDDIIMNGVYDNVPYYYWFDILEIHEGTEILANYHFDLTESGLKKMASFGVPDTFPAVIRASQYPLRFYMAGDWSDNEVTRGLYYVSGIFWINRIGRIAEHRDNQAAFFWEFYEPMMENLINYVSSRGGKSAGAMAMNIGKFGPGARAIFNLNEGNCRSRDTFQSQIMRLYAIEMKEFEAPEDAFIMLLCDDMTITETINHRSPEWGETVVYAVTVKNEGLADVEQMEIIYLLNPLLTYVSDMPSQGEYNNITGVWNIGTVKKGDTATMIVTAVVKERKEEEKNE